MVYLDTMILVYLVEGPNEYSEGISSDLDHLKSQHVFSSSALTFTEFLAGSPDKTTKPLTSIAHLSFIDVDEIIATKAGLLRRKHGLKIGDAIHLASCLNKNCEIMYTNDDKLAKAAAEYVDVLKPTQNRVTSA